MEGYKFRPAPGKGEIEKSFFFKSRRRAELGKEADEGETDLEFASIINKALDASAYREALGEARRYAIAAGAEFDPVTQRFTKAEKKSKIFVMRYAEILKYIEEMRTTLVSSVLSGKYDQFSYAETKKLISSIVAAQSKNDLAILNELYPMRLAKKTIE